MGRRNNPMNLSGPASVETPFAESAAVPGDSGTITRVAELLPPESEGDPFIRAIGHPRNLIVVLGMWLAMGSLAVAGFVMMQVARPEELSMAICGALLFVVCLFLPGKTTWNFIRGRRLA